MTNASIARPAYLPQLDALRGYGMMLVLLAHLPKPSNFLPGALIWEAEHVTKLAAIALDSFFVMSGFLITRLLLAERRRTGRISLPQFYLRRALRIFPIYYLAVIVVTWAWPTAPDRTASLLLYGYNYFLPFHPTPYPLEQSWSLAVEEQFYLLWPLLVILLPSRWLGWATVFFLPLAALASAIALAAFVEPELAGRLIYMSLNTRMLPLALGCFLAILEQRQRTVSLRTAGLAAALGTAVLLIALLGRSRGLVPAGGWYWTFVLPGVSLVAIGLVVTLIHPNAPAWIMAPFRLAAARFLGRISYAVYLVHVPVLFALGINDAALAGGPAPIGASILVVALSLALATASYVLIERPLARLKHRLDRRPAPVAA